MTSGFMVEMLDLRARYGRREVLKGITLDVQRNEILGIIGPAQSGKTTLLRIINRTIDDITGAVFTGRVKVDGEDVRQVKDVFALRRKVGMVAPMPVGLPLSIFDNVAFAPRMAGLRNRHQLEERVERCLRQAALWDEVKDRLHTRATTLQLGQQQKLCIARLLPLKPEVILMDEPCSALDSEATLGVEELMLTLAGRYTILIVTHNMAQARRVSHECAFMLLGEVVEHARTEDLFLTPKDSRTADYLEGRYG